MKIDGTCAVLADEHPFRSGTTAISCRRRRDANLRIGLRTLEMKPGYPCRIAPRPPALTSWSANTEVSENEKNSGYRYCDWSRHLEPDRLLARRNERRHGNVAHDGNQQHWRRRQLRYQRLRAWHQLARHGAAVVRRRQTHEGCAARHKPRDRSRGGQ